MSAAASVAPQPTRRPRRATRERWDTRPTVYPEWHPKAGKPFPKNTHRPKYGTQVQDLFGRNITLERMYQALQRNAKPLRDDPKILLVSEGAIGDLARITGREFELRDGVKGDLPYSTAAYTVRILFARHLAVPFDLDFCGPAKPRRPGQRHKTVIRLLDYDQVLQALFDDPNVGTPTKRTFYVIDGRPIPTLEAVLWGLDHAIAERMPEVWAENQRSLDPDAPMKPMAQRPKQTRQEIEQLLGVLNSNHIAIDDRQTARLIEQTRTVAREIPIEELTAILLEQLMMEVKRTRQPVPASFFTYTRMRGIGSIWLARRAQAAKEQRIAAERAASEPFDGTDPDPPPVVEIPRKPFPTR